MLCGAKIAASQSPRVKAADLAADLCRHAPTIDYPGVNAAFFDCEVERVAPRRASKRTRLIGEGAWLNRLTEMHAQRPDKLAGPTTGDDVREAKPAWLLAFGIASPHTSNDTRWQP